MNWLCRIGLHRWSLWEHGTRWAWYSDIPWQRWREPARRRFCLVCNYKQEV